MTESTQAEGDAPEPVTVLNPDGGSRFVLTCEHASNFIPARYNGLGLPPSELERHIAWDIGAADLARELSRRLDAPLFLSGYSRLLIDCNRPLHSPTSIVTVRAKIPRFPAIATSTLGSESSAPRRTSSRSRTRSRVASTAASAGTPTFLIGVHSFTPVFRADARRWQAGILYRNAIGLGGHLIAALRADPALEVGDNELYRVTVETDYTVPVHGDARGIPAALIEVRQDLLGAQAGIDEWASRLTAALATIPEDV